MDNNLRTKKVKVATWSRLEEKKPAYACVADVDLVVLRLGAGVSVLYGRCLHRGALMSDGYTDGRNLLCAVHGWDYRCDSGVSEYNNEEALRKFSAWVDADADAVYVDEEEIRSWAEEHPHPWNRETYQGLYADMQGSPEEPRNSHIHQLASTPPESFDPHGPVSAMGVPYSELPRWDDIQILTAQLHRPPLDDTADIDTTVTIGPAAPRPLELAIPLFVSDMSFGALSREAKIALAKGAEAAGTGIASGEGGMLAEEQQENSRYFYELAPAMFGWNIEQVRGCRAFHFKAGQAAKTGVGGLLPGSKVSPEIARVRGIEAGEDAHSPARFRHLETPEDFRTFADRVRETTGGIPVGFKLSAQHIESDIDFALEAGADYIILDGRGGGTGAAPDLLKQHTGVPTIAALARARAHLDRKNDRQTTLIITGGLRTAPDFIKALALGADAVAIANSAIQAAGCLSMRACSNNSCPVGIATQNPRLRERIVIEEGARRVARFLKNTTAMMSVLARACGHDSFRKFSKGDLTAWKSDVAGLASISYAGRPCE